MAEVTIEIDDQGNIGKLPEPVQKFFDKGFNEAFKKGASKVEAELRDKIADPVTIEKLKALEEENSRFREAEAKRKGEHKEAMDIAEQRHAAALKDREDKIAAAAAEVERRTGRLKSMLGSEIRAAAIAAGAREESLPELVKLLGADVDLDADLNPIVIGADGKALEKDGKPVGIEGLVTEYLASHPHHLKGSRGVPGRSTDGASFRRPAATAAEAQHEDALAAVASNPTTRTIAGAVRSIRQRASA